MEGFSIYQDIKTRTNGEIYLGVVGPVRTGKSTFIKRFMDVAVLPAMQDVNNRERTKDELPQSATGKTIMTTEPKFVPNEAVTVNLDKDCSVKVRLIDCVGFMVDGATGHTEDDRERLVKTPWFNKEIPFTKAAEIGTQKVIKEHSTIGVVIFNDGTFGEIPVENYAKAQEKTIKELKDINKPFIVILNSQRPYSSETQSMAEELSAVYNVSVLPLNCEQLREADIKEILEAALYEFPISKFKFYTPQWFDMLDYEHWLKTSVCNQCIEMLKGFDKVKDLRDKSLDDNYEYIENVKINNIDLSNGEVDIEVKFSQSIYYGILSELTQTSIRNELELISIIRDYSENKKNIDAINAALTQMNLNGFGIVTPNKQDIVLEEPEVIKNGTKYGVRIKASAPAVNLIKSNINLEIAPIVGSNNQANDLIDYINESKKDDPMGIWNANIFGKTMEEIVEDGIKEKTFNITQDNMTKISDTIEKVMNDNNGLV